MCLQQWLPLDSRFFSFFEGGLIKLYKNFAPIRQQQATKIDMGYYENAERFEILTNIQ